MSETVIDQPIDRSGMKVSDEVAIEIVGMNKWFGEFQPAQWEPGYSKASDWNATGDAPGSQQKYLDGRRNVGRRRDDGRGVERGDERHVGRVQCAGNRSSHQQVRRHHSLNHPERQANCLRFHQLQRNLARVVDHLFDPRTNSA